MKITNYYRGYIPFFECSIHGTIKMTLNEWQEVKKWLSRRKYLYFRDDLTRILTTKRGYFLNVRVPATEKIVAKYNLKNYKQGNYMIEIIEKLK